MKKVDTSVGERFAMFDEPLGPGRRGDLHEVGATHLQDVIDEGLKSIEPTDRQMAFEEHPIKARQNPSNDAGKLIAKRAYCRHGIRFQNGCLVTTILQSRMPFLHSYGRWAEPTLRTTPGSGSSPGRRSG